MVDVRLIVVSFLGIISLAFGPNSFNFRRRFDFLLISWVTNYALNRGFFYLFIVSRTPNPRTVKFRW